MNAIHSLLLIIALIALGFMSCEDVKVADPFKPSNAHEAYQHGLKQAGLMETALGSDWQEAANYSLHSPQAVGIPYQEVFYFSTDNPDAVGYSFSVKRGQKIVIDLDWTSMDSVELFVDLFHRDTLRPYREWQQIASAEKSSHLLGFEVRKDSEFILRIQPELLRSGQCKVQIKVVPILPFPVVGKDKQAIGSFFGDPREGGRRKHHGIDIFARRHTPIIAPTDGYVRFAGERGLGGRVVWMRDEVREMTLYFAHLHTIMVETGHWIKAGDTLGTVGNTGNARTTPPHLHFGIYEDGPIDPYDFVAELSGHPKRIRSDIRLVGNRVRTKQKVSMTDLSETGNIELPRYQLLDVLAGFSNQYRVLLPDGTKGLISMSDVESIHAPIKLALPPISRKLQASNSGDILAIKELEVQDEINIHGLDSGYWYVRTADGNDGWIEMAR